VDLVSRGVTLGSDSLVSDHIPIVHQDIEPRILIPLAAVVSSLSISASRSCSSS